MLGAQELTWVKMSFGLGYHDEMVVERSAHDLIWSDRSRRTGGHGLLLPVSSPLLVRHSNSAQAPFNQIEIPLINQAIKEAFDRMDNGDRGDCSRLAVWSRSPRATEAQAGHKGRLSWPCWSHANCWREAKGISRR